MIYALSQKQKRKAKVIFIYSGKGRNERAAAGVGMLIHARFQQQIDDIDYINERLLVVKIKINDKHVHFISAYAPDITKKREERRNLQCIVDNIPPND